MIQTYNFKCIVCGKNFIAHKSHAKVCSSTCRSRLSRSKRNRNNVFSTKCNINNVNSVANTQTANINNVAIKKQDIISACRNNNIDYSIYKLAPNCPNGSFLYENQRYYPTITLDTGNYKNAIQACKKLGSVGYVPVNKHYVLYLSEQAIKELQNIFQWNIEPDLNELVKKYLELE